MSIATFKYCMVLCYSILNFFTEFKAHLRVRCLRALIIATSGCLVQVPQNLAAATNFDFQFTSFSGDAGRIMGVFTATPSGLNTYQITGISGNIYGFNGAGPIGNLLLPGQFPAYYATDNVLIYPYKISSLTIGGVAFLNAANTFSYNIYYDGPNSTYAIWVADNPYTGYSPFMGRFKVTELPEIDGKELPKAIFIILAMYSTLFHSGKRTQQSTDGV